MNSYNTSRLSDDTAISSRPMLSNLSFQMTLYYGMLYSVVFAVLTGAAAVEKYRAFGNIVPLIVVLVWSVIEPSRFYFGYTGNLREMVPDLATHLLITAFPQLPLVIFLAFVQPVRFPVDIVLGVIMIAFLILDVILAFSTVRFLIKSQTAQFMRLCEDDSHND